MKTHLLAPMLLAGSLLAGMGPDRSPSVPSVDPPPAVKAIDRITMRTNQRLALPRTAGEPFRVAVSLDGAVHELDLSPYSMRASDFRVLEAGPDGGLLEVPAPAAATYRGSVEDRPESRVAASLIDGRLTAHIDLGAGAGVFCVQPLADLAGVPAAADEHVSFRTTDVLPHGYACGTEENAGEEEAPAEQAAAAGTGIAICEIGLEGDYPFYQENGSSIGGTVSDIEEVMNGVEFVYERDVLITYEITAIVVRTSAASDPYTSSNPPTLLCEFRNKWNSSPENGIKRDVAQLFTGRPIGQFSGGTIGIAYTGTVCNVIGTGQGCSGTGNLAYGIVESRFGGNFDERISLSAHELGHNWNAGHCSGETCHIMCADIDGCGGTTGENLVFGLASKITISSFRASRTCLVDLPEPLAPPFSDEFPDPIFDLDKWIWNQFASSSPDAIDPPSPPNALKLWSSGSAEYRDGEIRSNEILLGGESDLILSYQVQWQGVEGNEVIFIQYFSSDGIWTDINFVQSLGADIGIFFPFTHDLPANAYHDAFRLRFRVLGDETNDIWYVDDVYIGPEGGGDPCPGDIDGSGDTGFQDLLSILSNWGPCVDCPEDIDGSGDVGFNDLLFVLSNWGPCP